jgi:hypothetical protein
MTAIDALKAAREAGIKIAIDGDDLVLDASTPPAATAVEPHRDIQATTEG